MRDECHMRNPVSTVEDAHVVDICMTSTGLVVLSVKLLWGWNEAGVVEDRDLRPCVFEESFRYGAYFPATIRYQEVGWIEKEKQTHLL